MTSAWSCSVYCRIWKRLIWSAQLPLPVLPRSHSLHHNLKLHRSLLISWHSWHLLDIVTCLCMHMWIRRCPGEHFLLDLMAAEGSVTITVYICKICFPKIREKEEAGLMPFSFSASQEWGNLCQSAGTARAPLSATASFRRELLCLVGLVLPLT